MFRTGFPAAAPAAPGATAGSTHLRWRVTAGRTALAATLLLAAASLTSCGGDDDTGNTAGTAHTTSSSASAQPGASSSGQPAGQFNDADVEFAQNMIVHHEQAVQMADLAATKASKPQVKQLAEKIKAAQAPEIATLRSWLTAWGKPTAPAGGHGGGHTMPGMMTEADMGKLKAASGAEFDRMFLQMMIAHHEGAIEMARTEQADGENAQAMDLAAAIDKTQTAEIATMRSLAG